jgi:23S rRNA maturation-related 3'-5' exoribonuclease YhaM
VLAQAEEIEKKVEDQADKNDEEFLGKKKVVKVEPISKA